MFFTYHDIYVTFLYVVAKNQKKGPSTRQMKVNYQICLLNDIS